MFYSIVMFAKADVVNDVNNTYDDSVGKLELSGSDSFSYDVNNKMRKAKSSFNVGIGANMLYLPADKEPYKFNASVIAGYSYFFFKSFGIRGYLLFDNLYDRFYLAGGFDAMIDFFQIEQFGLGLIIGSSAGYNKFYGGNEGFLAQFHAGFSMIFDVGKSRLEALVRIPYGSYQYGSNQLSASNVTYILMYSYSF